MGLTKTTCVGDANRILLQYRQSIGIITEYAETDPTAESKSLVFSLLENIKSLGLTLSADALVKLERVPVELLRRNLTIIIDELEKYVGADVKYKPLWKNFPYDVREKSEGGLYFNAFLHYLSNGLYYPPEEIKEEDEPENDQAETEEKESIPTEVEAGYETELKVLGWGTEDDIKEIAFNFMKANTSLGDSEKTVLKYYFEFLYKDSDELPEMPFKENVIITTLFAFQYTYISAHSIKNWYKTATDVLRLYVGMSDGDISLSNKPKFKDLRGFRNKSARYEKYPVFDTLTAHQKKKFFMDLLANINGNILSDMYRYPEYWKRAGERICPGTFKSKKYNRVNEAFNAIRSGKKEYNWTGELNRLIETGSLEDAILHAAKRPGELARRLDYLLRISENDEQRTLVVESFMKTSTLVSPSVLYQVRSHFMNRDDRFRIINIKGPVRKPFIYPKNDKEIPEKYINVIVNTCENAIQFQNMNKPFMGNVYVDESIVGYLLPYDQRASHTSLSKPIVPGSRIPIPDSCKVVRTFLWWTNTKNNRTDLDLSATFYSENENEDLVLRGVLYYGNLTAGRQWNCHHSGDIVDGGPYDGDGVSEFIDIDINAVKNAGIRYVFLTNIRYYGALTMEELDGHISAGWMFLNPTNPYSFKGYIPSLTPEMARQIFDASKVDNKFSVSSATANHCMFAIDTFTREIVWIDGSFSMKSEIAAPNVVNYSYDMAYNMYAILHTRKPTMLDAIILNAQSRASSISTSNDANAEELRANADYVFAMDRKETDQGKVITPFMMDELMNLI